MKTSLTKSRHAFTLVELLVVIGIIGILMALLLPAVMGAIERARIAATAAEIGQLQDAIEAYKQKYSDYPPDMSSRAIVARHIRKAFPRIAVSEFNGVMGIPSTTPGMFYPNENGNYFISRMDPAEVLPFWLGGFSSDPDHPFTGPGGPFILDSSGIAISMNSDRNAPLFDFEAARLTQAIEGSGNLVSSDEIILHGLPTGTQYTPPGTPGDIGIDLFPVFSPKRQPEPYVYFDSRTYSRPNGTNPPNPPIRPIYPPSVFSGSTSIEGFAVPYRSDNQIPQAQATARSPWDISPPTIPLPFPFKWANPTTHQIIAPGSDGDYGNANFFKQFPSGNNYNILPKSDHDNISNFSDGRTFGDNIIDE